jgi:hypothetical protein
MIQLNPEVSSKFRSFILESVRTLPPLHRTLRDGPFGVAAIQVFRARLRSHRPSGTFNEESGLGNFRSLKRLQPFFECSYAAQKFRQFFHRNPLSFGLDVRVSRDPYHPTFVRDVTHDA